MDLGVAAPGPSREDLLALARSVIATDASAVSQLADQLGDEFLQVTDELLACRGKVFVSGMGTSGATARRVAHLLSVGSTPALYVSAGDGLHGQLGAITEEDILLTISKGGESDELNEHARRAGDRGALVIAMTSEPESTLARLATLRLITTTPDESDLGGMIAMGSALANCALGDALVAVTMSRRTRAWERFEHTHPGGAVGKDISARGGGVAVGPSSSQ